MEQLSFPDPQTGEQLVFDVSPAKDSHALEIQPEPVELVSDATQELITKAERSLAIVSQIVYNEGRYFFSASKVGKNRSSEEHWADLFSSDSNLHYYLQKVEARSGIVTRGRVVERRLRAKAESYRDIAVHALNIIVDGYTDLDERRANLLAAEEVPDVDVTRISSRREILRDVLSDEVVRDSAMRLAAATADTELATFIETYVREYGPFHTDRAIADRADSAAETLIGLTAMNLERIRIYWATRTENLAERFHQIRQRESRAIRPEDRERAEHIDRLLGESI